MKKEDYYDYDEYEDFFIEHFNLCGCSEVDKVIVVVRDLLKWIGSDTESRPPYDSLFGGSGGVYYLLVGMLDRKGYCGHGISIRHPWLSEKGEQLLEFLKKDRK